jgi:DNA invertase Pin-like site-specific DNA recombinase
MPKRYNRRPEPKTENYGASPLPVDRPAAIYYRQSTDAQIGNINTTLQTVDMFEHLVRQGWSPDAILMIDMDAGVSGSKKISERPGLSHVMDLIESGQISLVAAQDVDRFFRDVTQIQVNIFIDACKRNQVCILTPRMLYDFNHVTMGPYHMKIFRDEAQHAADYLEYFIKGRLQASIAHLHGQGQWAGRMIVVGYMVDMRLKLPDGTKNPDYRRYVPFEPCADVVRAYFALFKRFNRNLQKTYDHIEQYGPFFPDDVEAQTPDGFRTTMVIKNRSKHTGRLMPSWTSIAQLFTNVVYIGHWVHRGAIVGFYNHQPIVDEDLFMVAFNALSAVDFYGDPNPAYQPYRPVIRHDRAERQIPPPAYGGLVFSDSLPNHPHRRLNTIWNCYHKMYQYVLKGEKHRVVEFSILAHTIEQIIDAMLLERLKATTVDEGAWQAALASSQNSGFAEVRRIEGDIRGAERAKLAILENMKTLQHPDVLRSLESSYAAQEREIERLRIELEELRSNTRERQVLEDARPILDKIITRWAAVPNPSKRALFEALAHYATCNRLDEVRRVMTVTWRDGSETSTEFRHGIIRNHWTRAELEQLRDMIDSARPQVEILKAFPKWNWNTMVRQYADHFTTDGRFVPYYKGEKKYPYRCYWHDTEEYRAELLVPLLSSDTLRPVLDD